MGRFRDKHSCPWPPPVAARAQLGLCSLCFSTQDTAGLQKVT